MKRYNYLLVLGFCLVITQSPSILAGSWRISRAPGMSSTEVDDLISREARKYRVDLDNGSYRDLLYAAAANDSRILYYADDPMRAAKIYPTNVLSAASAIAKVVNGESAQVTQLLRHMLYYSN